MKRPFLERVVVVLWLLCGGVAAVTAFIGIAGLYNILSQPMSNTLSIEEANQHLQSTPSRPQQAASGGDFFSTLVRPLVRQPVPEYSAPQRGLGERVARVVSQIDTVTVVFLLLPSLLCIAFVSLFQYLVLGFFSPLALFRSRK
jgi:hypothetical protein